MGTWSCWNSPLCSAGENADLTYGLPARISAPRTSDVMGCLCRMHAWAPPGHTLARMHQGMRACMHHPPPLQSCQATTKALELYGVCIQKQQRGGSRRSLGKWGGQCTRFQVRLAVNIALCRILHCSPHFCDQLCVNVFVAGKSMGVVLAGL